MKRVKSQACKMDKSEFNMPKVDQMGMMPPLNPFKFRANPFQTEGSKTRPNRGKRV